ncbi:virB8 family protein [Lysobacter sp. N42]|uniref:virB8 family protein n=1 Tax=Lysobacter sp. N42 TaxID=2545719 RepID=UPI00104E48D2|nr:type IV secretion system protein [Lysobacter sp. N42]TCZ87241.1 conjugative transfer protein [Lysobacter sp. N42]
MKRRDAKDAGGRVELAVGRAVNYEVSLADLARRSERRAWWVAGSAVALSVLLGAGYLVMLPLKEKVPYLVMADAYSGTATVARLTGGLDDLSVTQWDALHRSNVAHYVLARESYDLALLKLRDWTTVHTMSAPQVATEYTTLNSSQNPESPFNVYGKAKAIRVQINSIQMIGGSATQRPKGATARFQRSLYDKSNGYTEFLDNRIATLEFTYNKNLKMDEKHRIENPLGFHVTSYRVDTDFASTPPPAVVATPAPAGTPMTAVPQGVAGGPAEALPAAMHAPMPTGLASSPMPQAALPAQAVAPVQAQPAPATGSVQGGAR